MSEQLWEFSASELAKMIRSKDVSSEEVIKDHLKRIDEVNPKLNAVTVVLEETALDFARENSRGSWKVKVYLYGHQPSFLTVAFPHHHHDGTKKGESNDSNFLMQRQPNT